LYSFGSDSLVAQYWGAYAAPTAAAIIGISGKCIIRSCLWVCGGGGGEGAQKKNKKPKSRTKLVMFRQFFRRRKEMLLTP
jgi:hypothetical protein